MSKQLYFKKFKPGISKIKQSLFAVSVLDPIVSKENQLLLFINICYLGDINNNLISGFEEAANVYFNKSFTSISEDEYLALVGTLVAPHTFNIKIHPEWNADRVGKIKKYLSGQYIPQGLMDQYYGPLSSEIIDNGLPVFSYFEGYYKD